MLSFQKLDVYRCAIDLLAVSATVTGRYSVGRLIPSFFLPSARVIAVSDYDDGRRVKGYHHD